MKVLLLHNNYPAQFKHLLPWLVNAGHDVTFLSLESYGQNYKGVRHSVISRKDGVAEPEHFPGNARFLGKKLEVADLFLGAFKQLKRKSYSPDLVIYHTGWGAGLHLKAMFPNAKLAAYAEWWFRWDAPDFYFEPDSIYNPIINEERLLRERLMNLTVATEIVEADFVWAPTYWQKSQFPIGLQNQMEVIHEGIDLSFFSPTTSSRIVPNDPITYATRGMEPMRGFEHLIPILSKLLESDSSRKVIIGGKDKTHYRPLPKGHQSMKQWAIQSFEKSNLSARVQWPGRLNLPEYRDLLTSSGLHIYFSRPFVASWSLLEAMACGCLLVVSDLALIREFVGNKENSCALLVDHRNHVQSLSLIENLLSDFDYQFELKKRALKAVKAYDVNVCLPRLLKALGVMDC